MPSLVTFVHVRDEVGANHIFGPGDVVPDWASKLITNPDAWAEGVAPAAPSAPPKSGPKGTVKAWTSYAKSLGFEIEPDATRTEIIAALKAENIPTE